MKKTYILFTIIYILICCICNYSSFAQSDTTELSKSFQALLNLSLQELTEVDIITASKKEQKISDAPSIISAFTKVDIEKLGVTSLIDILKYI